MKIRGWLALAAAGMLIALAGCSRADPSIIAAAPANTGGNTNAAAGPAALAVSADPGGQFKFVEATLQAAAGQPLQLTFKNPAPVQHSWVLVQPGQEQAVADAAAAKGGDVTGVPGVIAPGKVLNQNGTETVNVPALQPGTYTYLCTVPGHYSAGMKGTLTVGGATANASAAAASGEAAAAGGSAAAAGGEAPSGGAQAVSADPSGQFKFQPDTLTAKAGQAITVDFKNPAPVQHSWVLVQPGQEQAVADAAAAKGGDVTGVPGVIAPGKVLNANGEEQIQVPAQQAGSYSYICTVPGHYAAGMKGTFTVQP